MKKQKILKIALILTVAVCGALGITDHLLTQQIQELEENLGLYQDQDGVRIEKVEGADSDSDQSDEPETTGSLSEI
jgi:hypothetical protein